MCTITISEYKKHFEKYFKLGQQEPIKVTYRGKVGSFYYCSKKARIAQQMGTLIWLFAKGSFR